jgi:hypothetical protein
MKAWELPLRKLRNIHDTIPQQFRLQATESLGPLVIMRRVDVHKEQAVRTAGLEGRRFDRIDPQSSTTSAAFTFPLRIRRHTASVQLFDYDAPARIAAASRGGVSDDILVRDDTRAGAALPAVHGPQRRDRDE